MEKHFNTIVMFCNEICLYLESKYTGVYGADLPLLVSSTGSNGESEYLLFFTDISGEQACIRFYEDKVSRKLVGFRVYGVKNPCGFDIFC